MRYEKSTFFLSFVFQTNNLNALLKKIYCLLRNFLNISFVLFATKECKMNQVIKKVVIRKKVHCNLKMLVRNKTKTWHSSYLHNKTIRLII